MKIIGTKGTSISAPVTPQPRHTHTPALCSAATRMGCSHSECDICYSCVKGVWRICDRCTNNAIDMLFDEATEAEVLPGTETLGYGLALVGWSIYLWECE